MNVGHIDIMLHLKNTDILSQPCILIESVEPLSWRLPSFLIIEYFLTYFYLNCILLFIDLTFMPNFNS